MDSVPVLVKISGGEFESAYLYEDGLSSVEVQEQLDEFFIPKSVGISAVTEKNYPIQFHDRIAAFIGILMLLNLVFLFVARKDWIKKEPRFALLTVFLNSTGLLGLQVLVFAIGIAFALEYEASPATDVLSRIGRSSYIATPVLYLKMGAVILPTLAYNPKTTCAMQVSSPIGKKPILIKRDAHRINYKGMIAQDVGAVNRLNTIYSV